MESETQILIPLKDLSEAKASFSSILSGEQRRQLSLAMLGDILTVVDRIEAVDAMVVTPDEDVSDFVEGEGFKVIPEPGVGLNRALEIAIGKSIDSGFREALILPADVPLLKPDDIQEILSLAEGDRAVVITPSKENGTNALLLRPPDVIDLHFGGESFSEHVKEAQSRELKPRIYRSENLERDIDEPSHLLKVETLGKGTKTHSFLDSLK